MPYIDFAEIKERLPIEEAAQLLNLTPKPEGNQFRAACPACGRGGDRAIVLTPAKGLFFCFPAKLGGDCIRLAAHCLGLSQQEAALYLTNLIGEGDCTEAPIGESTVSKTHATAPQKPEGRTAGNAQPAPSPAAKPSGFDPDAFAKRLSYSAEVEALGISQEDATRLGVGFHSAAGLMRGRVVFPIRNVDGSVAGYIGWNGTDLKVPSQWLLGNVVRFQKRA